MQTFFHLKAFAKTFINIRCKQNRNYRLDVQPLFLLGQYDKLYGKIWKLISLTICKLLSLHLTNRYPMRDSLNKTGLFVIVFFAILVSLPSCKTVKHKTDNKSVAVEDFDAFYKRFHEDVAFQMTRINFPLGGELIEGNKTIKWTKNNWAPMKVKIDEVDTKMFKTSKLKTQTTFEQKVWIPNSGFKSVYKFELINNKWMLIYALEHNV